jgi:hypothetical protein
LGVLVCGAQVPEPFFDQHQWGYRSKTGIIITPQYDTAFAFDKSGRIAMVGNKNALKTEVNLLTGEETQVTDYYFINLYNTKLKLKVGNAPDSVTAFPNQQELTGNYRNQTAAFKILYNHKVWLFSKAGRQLSEGYDDIFPSPISRFYFIETYTEWDNEVVRSKGLIDINGRLIVACEKKHIHINVEDSIIYACSAIFNKRLSDEVFDYHGKMIYTNKNHIEFASRHIYVYKLYDPKEVYMFENRATKELFSIEGEQFYYLQRQKALIVNKDSWSLVNLETGKKQKVNKDAFNSLIYKLTEF